MPVPYDNCDAGVRVTHAVVSDNITSFWTTHRELNQLSETFASSEAENLRNMTADRI